MHGPGQLLGAEPRLRVPGEDAGLWDVRRRDRRARQDQLDERRLRVTLEKPRPRLRDHHRVHHDRSGGRQQLEGLRDRLRGRHGTEHPDLHGVHAEVVGDRAHLLNDHRARHRLDRHDGDRVLCGDRGDRSRAVDAGARERLQVGLDPSTAAGVRSGDREADRYAILGHGGEG